MPFTTAPLKRLISEERWRRRYEERRLRQAAGSGGGGVTDHGGLTGLGDDDHPQYLTEARADTWLAGKSVGGIESYTFVTSSPYTAAAGDRLAVDTTSGEITINLPAGVTDDIIEIEPNDGNFYTNKVIVTPASGESIEGGAADEVMNITDNMKIALQYTGSEWEVVGVGSTSPNGAYKATKSEYGVITRTTDQSFTANVGANIQWESVTMDTAGFADLGTNNDRLTIPTGFSGTKAIVSCLVTTTSTTGRVFIIVRKNGVSITSDVRETPNSRAQRVYGCSEVIDIAPGDYFDVRFQNTVNGDIDASADCYFSIQTFEEVSGGSSTAALDRVKVSLNADQSIPTSSNLKVAWDEVEEDTNGFADLGTDDTVITIPTGYGGTRADVSFSYHGTFAAAGTRTIGWIQKNGSIIASFDVEGSRAGGTITAIDEPITPGDTFSGWVFHSAAGESLQGSIAQSRNYLKMRVTE